MGDRADATLEDLALASRLQLQRSPYWTLGATFGAGFILGGGVPLRLLTFAAAFGGRLAASLALRELTTTALRLGATGPKREDRPPPRRESTSEIDPGEVETAVGT